MCIRDRLRDVSNTTTINQLTQNKFNDFLIPIPPVRAVSYTHLQKSEVENKIHEVEKQLEQQNGEHSELSKDLEQLKSQLSLSLIHI